MRGLIYSLVLALCLPWLAFAGSLHQVAAALAPALLMIRNGDATGDNDHKAVVALKSRGRKYNEETQKYETSNNICTGTVFNRYCVVTSAHCIDENAENIRVFADRIVNENSTPVTTGTRKVRRKEGAEGNDLMVIRLKHPVPRDRSLRSSVNLPTPEVLASLMPNDRATIVGYGATVGANGNYRGTGEKRSGQVHLAKFDPKSGFVDVVPGKKDQAVTPGDSGGPLIWHLPNGTPEGTPIVLGVAANMNSDDIAEVTRNQHVATFELGHAKWLNETFDELGCKDELTPQEQLADFVLDNFSSPDHYLNDWKKFTVWRENSKKRKELEALVRKASGFDAQFENSEAYPHLEVTPLASDDGQYHFRWSAHLVANPKDTELENNILIRNFGRDWRRPQGELIIPAQGGEAVSHNLTAKLPRPKAEPLRMTISPNPPRVR